MACRRPLLLLALLTLLAAQSADAACGYESCPALPQDMVNVHLIPHTHDDVGWLKNPDEYFYGARDDIQRADVWLAPIPVPPGPATPRVLQLLADFLYHLAIRAKSLETFLWYSKCTKFYRQGKFYGNFIFKRKKKHMCIIFRVSFFNDHYLQFYVTISPENKSPQAYMWCIRSGWLDPNDHPGRLADVAVWQVHPEQRGAGAAERPVTPLHLRRDGLLRPLVVAAVRRTAQAGLLPLLVRSGTSNRRQLKYIVRIAVLLASKKS